MAAIPGAVVDVDACETNILFVQTARGPTSYEPIVQGLRARGVLAVALGELGLRLVTHRDVDDGDVERALAALRELIPLHGAPAGDGATSTRAGAQVGA